MSFEDVVLVNVANDVYPDKLGLLEKELKRVP